MQKIKEIKEIFEKLHLGCRVIIEDDSNMYNIITKIIPCIWQTGNYKCDYYKVCKGYIGINNKMPECCVVGGQTIFKKILPVFEFEKELFEV